MSSGADAGAERKVVPRAREISIALVHHPVLDAKGAVVTTAITNLDVHDLARSARTYGCARYVIVHPITVQRELVERICKHWAEGSSGKRIPDRKVALALVEVAASLEETYTRLGGRDAIEVWATAARSVARAPTTLAAARESLRGEGKPVLILFGTGWGLDRAVIESVDRMLAPVRAEGETGYNHLSVRAACAIVLDRLAGER